MHSKCVFKHFNGFFRLQNSLLGCFWIGGLLLGILLGMRHSLPISAVFCVSMIKSPSLLNGVFVLVVPVLLMVLILMARCYVLTYPLLFVYARCHGFCGALLSCLLGNGAWLLRLMLLFPAGGASFLLWFLLQRYRNRCGSLLLLDVVITVSFLCCILVVNHISISPVLTALVDYF